MPDCLPPLEHPRRPSQALPPGAWDTHCHVFGPPERFPYAEGRSYTPPDAPFERLAALHRHIGVKHAVVVQAACHGADHRALLDALAQSQGRYRGVAVIAPDIPQAELLAMHAAGVRGARLNFVPHLGTPPDAATVLALADRIAPLGWHLCLHVDGASLPGLLPLLKRLPLPYVVDHMGRVQAARGLDDPAFRGLLSLAAEPAAWVKISGIDRISQGKRPFHDGLPFMRALADAMPQRLLWGSDWPHPNVRGDMPDDGEVVDALFLAVPDAALRHRILVDNPAQLYEFA
ncbi:amidohydrolase family protein [Bordetella genomosp. 12]|uniref:Amidohydrolase n=1 Tax=Bordetella genomosp. 12 TaxID=463035 RepID=A0A261VLI8_9BORD|nr:amidohydrolase family protein [Bordetella genomosp. 12]OZI74996.1 amidohydrolase [Bordetella genomosp. 12]